MKRRGLRWTAFALLAIVPACTSSDRNAAQSGANRALQGIDKAARALSTAAPVLAAKDALLATAVKARLVAANVDSAGSVGVQARAGVVTLSGAVRTRGDVAVLSDAARSVSGVRSVATNLHVDPHLPSAGDAARDLALATRVTAAIAAQAGTNALRVHVLAKNGVATLEGTAPSPAIRATIHAAAAKTTGVTSVIDHLTVRP